MWLRLLIVAAVLLAASPIIKVAFARLGDRFVKMSAEDVEAALAKPPFMIARGPETDLQCEISSARACDYICTYAYQPGVSTKRMKIGVRVAPRSIKHISPPHELDARVIR